MSADKLAVLIISAIVILGFGGVVISWMIYPPKTDNLLAALIGALTSGYGQVIFYWFRPGGGSGQ